MRYALLVYSDQSAWSELSEEEAATARAESMPGWEAVFGELSQVDPAWDGKELDAASEAKVIRIRDGERIVTDGPYAETKEILGGYVIADCKDLDQAIELAQRVPLVDSGSVEIRPLLNN